MDKTVSVVITTKNRLTLLKRAIDSAQSQSLVPCEIIVVDDCSTDGTVSHFENHLEENLKFIRLEEPSGANVARNRGIDTASGEFIAFLDDDDFWKKDKLKKQVNMMIELHAPFSYTGLHNVTPEEKTIKERFYPPSDPENIRKSLMINNFMGSTSCIAVNRQFINEHNIRFDEQLGSMQDYDFYLSCFSHTNSVAAVPECLTYYHQERSVLTGKTSAKYDTFARSRAYLLNKLAADPYVPLLKRSLDTVRLKKCIKYPRFLLGAVKSLFAGK